MCTAVWRRHAITRVFWDWFAHLETWWAEHELVAVVGESGDPQHQAMLPPGATLVSPPNQPLGAKFNATLTAARALEADAILIMGSDDLFCARTAQALLEAYPATQYSALRDLYFCDTPTGRLGYWQGYHQPLRIGEPAGCGRLLGAKYLDACEWKLWKDAMTRGMDHSSFRTLKAVNANPTLVTVKTIRGMAVDLKGPDNLWNFRQVGAVPCDASVTLDRLPADLVAAIDALRPVEVAA